MGTLDDGEAFTFFTHGVSVQMRDTNDPGLTVRRDGNGTTITQSRGTNNEFVFALPSATRLDGDAVITDCAFLRGEVSDGAKITHVQIRENQSGGSNPVIFESEELNIVGLPINRIFSIRRSARGPLAMSIYTEFTEDGGTVQFSGAGCRCVEE